MEILRHVGNTIFGMYQHPFCQLWDDSLNKIINECEVVELSEYTMTFGTTSGQICVWCANRWYAFGHVYSVNDKCVGSENERRPRFSTMQKLQRIHSRLWSEKLKADYNRLMGVISG